MALKYAGISFTDVNTVVHTYGPAKDPSGSDQLYTVFEIAARAIFNVAYLPAELQDNNIQVTVARVRHYLTQPRQAIYYDITSLPDEQSATPIIDLPNGRDDAGGPWPDDKAFQITYTTADTLEVFWKCTVKLRDCGSSAPSEPLSLRWEDTVSWDNTFKATLRRTGTLIISSLQNQNIDWFRRNKLSFPVLAGFKRVAAHYTCSKDGLRCEFAFQDEQIRWAPPGNCVEMNIVQSESGNLHGGMRVGAIQVVVQGIQNANPKDLVLWSLRVCAARMWSAKPINQQGIVPGKIVVETRENSTGVEATSIFQYKVQPNQVRVDINAMAVNHAGLWGLGAAGGLPAIGGIIAAQATQQGRNPVGVSWFPWVGYGTTADSPGGGFAVWANPNAAINAPADGVGLAPSIALFAALLQDPCGNALAVNPNAPTTGTQSFRTQVNYYNDVSYGHGGTQPVNTAQLSGSVAVEGTTGASKTFAPADQQGLTIWDGQPGVYDHWQCNNEYVYDPGVIVLPVNNPSANSNLAVNHSSPMLSLIRRWAAKRSGSPPALPDEVVLDPSGNEDPNWVLVKSSAPNVRELGLAPDGVSIVYEATGYYVFQSLKPRYANYLAEIPPTLNPYPMQVPATWPNGTGLNAATGDEQIAIVTMSSGGGANPLGNNGLPVLTPN